MISPLQEFIEVLFLIYLMKKLLVILGAGASVEFGMPSVDEIDKLFEKWSWRHFPLTNGDKFNDNLYRWVKDNFKSPKGEKQNFENILHTIQSISSFGLNRDSGLINLFDFKKTIKFPEIRLSDGLIKIAEPIDFAKLNAILNHELLKFLREKCKNLKLEKETELGIIKEFFDFMRIDYELGFVNLNYDNVLLTALPELSTGFDRNTGKFDMMEIYENQWDFCYHLHGSVHFDMSDGDEEVVWNNNMERFGLGAPNRRGFLTSEGGYHPMSTIITGLDKINQVYREPFRQYFLNLDRKIYESDMILFVGYGFNDSYINKLIRTHSKDTSKKRNIVVIDYKDEKTKSLFKGGDEWGYKLLGTAYVPFFNMGNGDADLTYRPDMAGEYKRTRTFEFSVNMDNPLYVWYSGFLDACKNKEKVKKALQGCS